MEMYLKVGIEGGSITVYKETLPGGHSQFVEQINTMDLDEDGDEVWIKTETPYPTFVDFLKNYITIHPNYMSYKVRFIHEEIKLLFV